MTAIPSQMRTRRMRTSWVVCFVATAALLGSCGDGDVAVEPGNENRIEEPVSLNVDTDCPDEAECNEAFVFGDLRYEVTEVNVDVSTVTSAESERLAVSSPDAISEMVLTDDEDVIYLHDRESGWMKLEKSS